jgi:hypothetical protein
VNDRDLEAALRQARRDILAAWNAIPRDGDTWIEPSKAAARRELARAAERIRCEALQNRPEGE